jgi:hypothetical protein
MAVSFPGGPAPAPGADDPLALLSACHGRIARQCATLGRLAAHLPAHGSDAAARTAAASVLRYFDTAAAHHHEDEDEDLHALVDGLVAEHRQLARRWEPLRQALAGIAEGRPADLPADEVKDFTDAYAAHIRREEDELLPMAARLIPDEALAAIGQAMKARRGGEAG